MGGADGTGARAAARPKQTGRPGTVCKEWETERVQGAGYRVQGSRGWPGPVGKELQCVTQRLAGGDPLCDATMRAVRDGFGVDGWMTVDVTKQNRARCHNREQPTCNSKTATALCQPLRPDRGSMVDGRQPVHSPRVHSSWRSSAGTCNNPKLLLDEWYRRLITRHKRYCGSLLRPRNRKRKEDGGGSGRVARKEDWKRHGLEKPHSTQYNARVTEYRQHN